MARRVLLVRHAAPPPQYAGRYVGVTDAPLGPTGLAQADALAQTLATAGASKCYCSPAARTRQTADPIAKATGLCVQIDPDLREVDFGQWEGRTFAEIAKDCSAAVARWSEFADDFAFPGGESIATFLARVRRAATRLADDPAEVVLAVTHGGVIRSMICHFLGLSPNHYILFDIRCAATVTLELFDGKGVLAGLGLPAPAKEGPPWRV